MAQHGALETLKDLAEKEVDDAARLLGECVAAATGGDSSNADRLSE